ncbi:hypothetical protein LCGC14_1185630 [marine sediment metagenome]|uniref:Uncharacterized protein n=1 Tax=marine sediment metagenome TaxID=412755 RepID=A0A0F9P3Q0_9ZZZZ
MSPGGSCLAVSSSKTRDTYYGGLDGSTEQICGCARSHTQGGRIAAVCTSPCRGLRPPPPALSIQTYPRSIDWRRAPSAGLSASAAKAVPHPSNRGRDERPTDGVSPLERHRASGSSIGKGSGIHVMTRPLPALVQCRCARFSGRSLEWSCRAVSWCDTTTTPSVQRGLPCMVTLPLHGDTPLPALPGALKGA